MIRNLLKIITKSLSLALLLSLATPALAEGTEGPKAKPSFVSMNPHFTVNLGDGSFLQLTAQTLVNNDQTSDAIKDNMAPIRHNIILYLSDLFPEDLRSAEQRERLRQELTHSIRNTLKKLGQSDDVKAFYITSLIVQ